MTPLLLEILRCPETMQTVALAPAEVLRRVADERLPNRAGEVLGMPEAGLLREDGAVLYPVRDGIPRMLWEEAIVLNAERGTLNAERKAGERPRDEAC